MSMNRLSKLDQLYRSILVSKFFTKGWGNPDQIKRLFEMRQRMKNRETCYSLVSPSHPIQIDKEELQPDCRVIEGRFKSPFAELLPGVVPEESETAYFQMILPKEWKTPLRPVCLQLGGTGDHYFWRRRTLMAKPLLKEYGIASIILENPFYGLRKPKDQVRSNLHNVSDIIVMGGCLMLETITLFNWCERNGLGPLGVTGISMGGHMACISAGVWPKPCVLVPCLSWSTASCVFTQGVMSGAIPWHLLENQYFSNDVYHNDLRKMICHLTNDDAAFRAGQHFAKTYPSNTNQLRELCGQEKEISQERMSSGKEQTDRFNVLNFSPQYVSTMSNERQPSQTVSDEHALATVAQPALNRLNLLLPKRNSKSNNQSQMETLQFMRGIMDEFTHLANFARPVDLNLVIIVAARDDAYVLREGVTDLTQLWKGAEVRYIDTGHIAAFLFNQHVFRKAVANAFDKLVQNYYTDGHENVTQKHV